MNVQLVSPVLHMLAVSAIHDTAGLPGYPAHDWFAPAGSPVIAPATGRVTKLSGHDPALGPISGPHGPLGWSIYITDREGVVWYLTHMGRRDVALGHTVQRGEVLGTVASWGRTTTPPHVHMGLHLPALR